MRNFYFLLFFTLFFYPNLGFAQTDSLTFSFGKNEGSHPQNYVLTGRILDKISLEPIDGAGIHVDGIYTGINSDRFGTYYIKISPGDHTVTFRHVSKIPISIQVILYADGVVNLKMQDKSYELEGVVVMSSFEKRIFSKACSFFRE